MTSIIFLCFFAVNIALIQTIVVSTKSGNLRGLITSFGGKPVSEFRGVQYAESPTEIRRFQKPVPVKSWTGIRDATDYKATCLQNLEELVLYRLPNRTLSEDCLYLNIYIPGEVNITQTFPVLVVVHGMTNEFSHAASSMFDGSSIAVAGTVIVVTFNYRVGLFGFISTGDSGYPGNYGLWDQQLAMTWVHDNINVFGGDNDRITLWGNSAGGASVFLHSIAPSSKGKFRRIIVQSGFGFKRGLLATDPRATVTYIGGVMGCDLGSSTNFNVTKIVECIKSKPADEILTASIRFAGNRLQSNPTIVQWIGPVVDNDFLADVPEKLLADNTTESYSMFTSTDMIVGMVDADGAEYAQELGKLQTSYDFNIKKGIPTRVLCEVVAPGIANRFFNGVTRVSEEICKRYTSPGSDVYQAQLIVKVYRDFFYAAPLDQAMRIHPNFENSHRYLYLFQHEPQLSSVLSRPPWLVGAGHIDDFLFVFDIEKYFQGSKLSEEELELSKSMVEMWSRFAATGYPTRIGRQWPQYDNRNEDYIILDIEKRTEKHLYFAETDFWINYIPSIAAEQEVSDSSTTSLSPAVHFVAIALVLFHVLQW